jgi:hypothetical protein
VLSVADMNITDLGCHLQDSFDEHIGLIFQGIQSPLLLLLHRRVVDEFCDLESKN